MTTNREFDLIIFGATGFTGYYMVRELIQVIDENPAEYSSIKWAVAGRNGTKLDETLVKLAQELNKDLSKIVRVQADVSNAESLLQMAQRTRLVVNVVGPFQLFGKQVVEACANVGTHHIDISGEPTYIESSQIEFDAKAKETGALILSTCGWDSIPADAGCDYLKTKFDGQLHSVESFMKIHIGQHGYAGNFGTYHSAINFVSDYFSYLRIHSRLYSEVLTAKLPQSRIRLPMRLLPFTRPQLSGWNLPFIGADKPVVERTQHYQYVHFNEKPVQYQPYINFPRFLHTLGLISLSTVLVPLAFVKPGRYLLEKYPEKISFGFFTKKGPSREQIETTRFSLTLIGKGWSKDSADNEESSRPFDKEMTLVVSGRDPAYLATSTCTIIAGLTILKESEKMPKGGVLTPASAFRGTNLIERLQSRGLKFDFVAN